MIAINRLKEARKKKGLTQKQVAEYIGISQNAYSYWESGRNRIDDVSLQKLADFFGVSVDYLLGRPPDTYKIQDVIVPQSKSVMIPVLGTVPAGTPIEAIQDVIEWVDIPEEWTRGGKEYFGLVVKGESMLPEYRPGDYVIVRVQPYCNSGSVCVVFINGQDATLKKVILRESGMVLQPLNPDYEPLVFTPAEVLSLPVEIKGVVVELRRKMIG